MLRLSKAEMLLRQDRLHEALEVLGGSNAPPDDLPVEHHPVWYWLAGWALGLDGRPTEAVVLLERGLGLAEFLWTWALHSQKPRLAEMVERLRCYLAIACCALDQTELALLHYRRGLTAIEDNIVTDPELKMLIYKGLGLGTLMLGRYTEALTFYRMAARQADDLDNARQLGLTYWGLGMAYQKSGDLARARTSYEKALHALGIHGNRQLIAQVRTLIGQVLTNLGEYEEAERHLNKSLEGARRLGDTRTCGVTLANVAALSIASGKYEQAIREAQEGLKMVQQSGDQRAEGQLHLTLASAYEGQQGWPMVEQELREALLILQRIQNRDVIGLAHERYAQFLALHGSFEGAYVQMHLAYTTAKR